jgi:hypothetical protein
VAFSLVCVHKPLRFTSFSFSHGNPYDIHSIYNKIRYISIYSFHGMVIATEPVHPLGCEAALNFQVSDTQDVSLVSPNRKETATSLPSYLKIHIPALNYSLQNGDFLFFHLIYTHLLYLFCQQKIYLANF